MNLPDFGIGEACATLPPELLRKRIGKICERMHDDGVDTVVVYGDREHFANLAYFTGFDPRFEEALLLLKQSGDAKLLVGNECMGYLPDDALGIDVECFQPFSLMGQARDQSRPLRTILSAFGINGQSRVGCVGWKTYPPPLVDGGPSAIDLPAYIVDTLRALTNHADSVYNVTSWLADPENGLRVVNEPEQIACFEYAASVTSTAVLELLRHIEPGIREDELERFLDSKGLPLTCHRMVGFGQKVRRGLASASANTAKLGAPFTVAFGVNGALNCRAGMVAHGPDELPAPLREFYPRYVANYLAVVRRWYETVAVNAIAGEIFEAVDQARDSDLFTFAVNPGHYIHLDEWVHSPFAADSTVRLKSGMALQMDIIPVSSGPFCYANAEDGVVLADEALRQTLATRYPGMWQRIQNRHTFMVETLGIAMDESLLPLSNMPGWMPPYVLDMTHLAP